jgi:hypothetical protein
VERRDGVAMDGSDGELLVLMKPETWLEGIPVAECLEKGDLRFESGVLYLDDNAKGGCSAVEDTLKRNLKRSMDLTKRE